MRIRKPFAGAFAVLCLLAGYTGLAPVTIPYSEYHSDKVLHFVTFFLLTITFYFTLDTTRRKVVHITVVVCTLGLGVGSEILQAVLPNGRDFDPFDIAGNVAGSLAGLGLSAAYHRRMLERKRAARGYRSVAGDEEQGVAEEGTELVEGTSQQKTGVSGEEDRPDLDEELDQWDENAEDDWENQSATGGDDSAKVKGTEPVARQE